MAFNLFTKSNDSEASISLSIEHLKKFLVASHRIVPQKTTIEILKHIRICSTDGKGFIMSTNLDNFVVYNISVTGTGIIDLTIPLETLENAIAKNATGIFLIERTGDNLTLKVGGSTGITIKGEKGEYFPILKPIGDVKDSVHINLEDVEYVNKYLIPYCTGDDTKYPALGGVLVIIDGDTPGFVTTNRQILVYTKMPLGCNRYVVPTSFFKILDDVNINNMDVGFTDTHVYAQVGNIKIISALCKHPYPNVEGAMPKTFKYVVKCQVKAIKDIVDKYIASQIGDIYPPIKVGLNGYVLKVNHLRVPSQTETPALETESVLKLSPTMLQSVLSRFNDFEEITYSHTQLNTATEWKNNKATTLLMPMLTND